MHGLIPMLAGEALSGMQRPRRNQNDLDDDQPNRLDPRCLIDAVEFDVIPLLLDAHGGGNHWAEAFGPRNRSVLIESSIEPLTEMVLNQRLDDAMVLINDLRARGTPIASIYLDLLGETAQRLGVQWEDDDVSFADVSIGLCVLHQIMYRLSPDFRSEHPDRVNGRNALFAPSPDETHFFGVLMAADFFARDGWQVWTESEPTADRLIALIREEQFDLVGFSISCDKYVDRTGDLIAKVRSKVSHPLKIIVGGRAVAENAHHVGQIGADAVAMDAADGIRLADAMLDKEPRLVGSTAIPKLSTSID